MGWLDVTAEILGSACIEFVPSADITGSSWMILLQPPNVRLGVDEVFPTAEIFGSSLISWFPPPKFPALRGWVDCGRRFILCGLDGVRSHR